jgi:alpha-methylacyl-CoA racemase
MLLADAGASVLRIDRPAGAAPAPTADILARHKSSIAVDLRHSAGVSLVRALALTADVLIDPFRPGVLERLGLGPEPLRTLNPRLIYARLTGFRRDGRFRDMAGHDINYLAVSGVLAMLGRAGQRPYAPGNLLADFAGGGMVLVLGILMALLERSRNGGRGQVVEANMVDGSAYLASFLRMAMGIPGVGDGRRGENLLDGGCPYYDAYETKDGTYMAVGALEGQFFQVLIEGLGLQAEGWEDKRHDRQCWPDMRRRFEEVFKQRTRAQWEQVFAGTDACCTAVYDYRELEGDAEKEGDQRPVVTLKHTPLMAVQREAQDPARGQGPGVEGEGYAASFLEPGQGGEKTLRDWLGWRRGRDYDVQDGTFVLIDRSKL